MSTEIVLEVVEVPLPPEKAAAYYHSLELIWELIKDVPAETARLAETNPPEQG